MEKEKIQYERLAGKGRDNPVHGNQLKLYLGPDHLLQVESADFRENYKRYFYRDIQAIVVRRSKRRLFTGIIVGILMLLSVLIGWASWSGGFGPDTFILSVAAASLTVVLLVNLLSGPTVHVYLRTAVGSERLTSLLRERTAQDFINRIRPRIESAQEDLVAGNERSSVYYDSEEPAIEPKVVSMSQRREPFPAMAARPPRPLRHCSGRAHKFLFAFLIFNAFHSIVSIFLENGIINGLGYLNFVGFVGFITWTLFSQRQSNLDRRLKVLPYATLTYFALGQFVMSIAQFMDSHDHPGKYPRAFEQADAIISIGIAAYGFFLLSSLSRPRAKSSPPPIPAQVTDAEEGSA